MYDPDTAAGNGVNNAKTTQAYGEKTSGLCGAMREITVGELLDQRIEKAERLIRALRDLKSSLPGSYLTSGFSRVGPFLEGVK